MADSDQDEFDGYRKWLGIINHQRVPTHYELLAISVDETDNDVIRAAAEQRRNYVESKRGLGHDSVVTEILYRINEAEVTLLNSQMRRDYDRKMNLFQKRQKNRQIDPDAPPTRRVRTQPAASGDEGIVKTFFGITAVVCVAFGIMAWLSFHLPWNQRSKQAEATAIVPAPALRNPAREMPRPDASKPAIVNEKFLEEWDLFPAEGKSSWSVKDGILRYAATGPSLVSKQSFDDFDLHLDFKLPAKFNGGIRFQGCELKLVDSGARTNKGQPIPAMASCGAIDGQVAPSTSSYRGTDKWNSLVVRVVGQVITVWMNDVVVVNSHKIKRYRRIDGLDPSKIMLVAGEVGGLEFREIGITPIHDPTIKSIVAIQGDWLCVVMERGGKSQNESAVLRENRCITFEGKQYTLKRTTSGRRVVETGTFEINGANNLLQFRGMSADGKALETNGLFKLDGDSLKLNDHDKNGSDTSLSYMYRRIDPDRPPGYVDFLTKRLAGTKWNNSLLQLFEWTDDGRCLHNGIEREWMILDGREVQIIIDADHVDTLVFNETLTEFEQLVKGGPDSIQGSKHGTNRGGHVRNFEGHVGTLTTISFSPDGVRAVSSGDKAVRCWDVSNGKLLWTCDDFTSNVRYVRFFPDGRKVIASAANRCSILDADTGKSILNTGKSDVFAISDDCRLIAIRKKGNTGLIYDLERRKETRKFSTAAGATVGKFARDNSLLMYGSVQLDRLDLTTGRQTARHIVQPTNSLISTADFSPDDEFLATGSQLETFLDRGQSMGDRTVRLWNVRTGKLERELKDHRDFIYSVAFTPNGKRLLSAGGGTLQNLNGVGSLADRSIRLWDVETGRVLRTFDGHEAAVHALSVSSDGRFFLSGGADSTMILWQLPE